MWHGYSSTLQIDAVRFFETSVHSNNIIGCFFFRELMRLVGGGCIGRGARCAAAPGSRVHGAPEGSKIITLNFKKIHFLRSTVFILQRQQEIQQYRRDFFSKFVICIRGGHCGYSPRASKNIAKPLEIPVLCLLQICHVSLVLGREVGQRYVSTSHHSRDWSCFFGTVALVGPRQSKSCVLSDKLVDLRQHRNSSQIRDSWGTMSISWAEQ